MTKVDINKNSVKLEVFGILPKSIIIAEESNSYLNSGTRFTDKKIPNFSTLNYKYYLLDPKDWNKNKIQFGLSGGKIGGGIRYTNQYGAGRIISFQTPSMEKQSWHLNLIFETESDAKTAWENLLKHYNFSTK